MNNNGNTFDLLTINQIFNNGYRTFQIPSYQRGYSWEKEHRDDLKEDLEVIMASDNNYRHFTGTIVATFNEEQSNELNIDRYEIVDGQQRLTSLVILLSLLAKELEEKHDAKDQAHDLFKTFVAEGFDKGNTIRKFKTGEDQDNYFFEVVVKRNPEQIDTTKLTKSDHNIINAFHEFDQWLSSKDYQELLKVKKAVLENIGFLFYTPQHSSEAGMMFEVINNRGKPLSQLEKIKNYLIYFAETNSIGDLKHEVQNYWPDILRNLNFIHHTSNDEENSFLRNCWIVFDPDTNKQKSYHVYEHLKKKWPPEKNESWQELQNFIRFLYNASVTYKKFFALEDVSKEEEKWLNRIKHHPSNASVIPLIISIFEQVKDEKRRVRLLELIEKLNFRFYVTGVANRADSGQGSLFDFAHSLYSKWDEKDDDEQIINDEWLERKLIKFINNKANDKKFIQSLVLDKDESGDMYKWHGLKFFLASYEEKLREENNESLDIEEFLADRDKEFYNNFYHKEHILANKARIELDDKDEVNVNKRRIGNFILLKETQNIKVGAKPPEKKVKLYLEDKKNAPNTIMIRELKDWFDEASEDCNHWKRRTKNYWEELYKSFLDKREQKLLEFALYRWKVDGLENPVTGVKVNSLKDSDAICEVIHAEKETSKVE